VGRLRALARARPRICVRTLQEPRRLLRDRRWRWK
jgi:hypothetical protein